MSCLLSIQKGTCDAKTLSTLVETLKTLLLCSMRSIFNSILLAPLACVATVSNGYDFHDITAWFVEDPMSISGGVYIAYNFAFDAYQNNYDVLTR